MDLEKSWKQTAVSPCSLWLLKFFGEGEGGDARGDISHDGDG